MEALGINLPKFLFQLINFSIVIWLLYMWLYQPVLKLLNERTERISQSLQDAEQVKQQLANAKSDYEKEINKARQEAAAILQRANEQARTQAEGIVADARVEAERVREEIRAQAEQERQQMLRESKDQIADLVTLTASKVLQSEVSRQGHEKLIEESLTALGRQN